MKFTEELHQRLTVPFDDSEIKFKPTALRDGRALALAYVDARTILDRLDEVVGTENWQDDYEVVSENRVICKLTVLGVTKSDAGEADKQDKEPLKSAVSDALKRAAVKFGIGRYLYRLPKMWCKYDSTKNEFVENPIAKNSTFKPEIIEENVPIPQCEDCGEKITNRVAVFSKKYYAKPLCMKCQSTYAEKAELAHK